MASLSQVTLEFASKGEEKVLRVMQQLERAQERLERGMRVSVDASNQNARSLDRIVREAAKAEREIRRLHQAKQKGVISGSDLSRELLKITRNLRGMGMANAQREVMGFSRALGDAANAQRFLSTATVSGTQNLDRLENQINQTTTALRTQNTANGAMRQGMSRASVAIQQTGYQVGDFLVQVQSGTNMFVAFGQQATQLAGLLTLSMNPKLIALGAALSIAIPLATALGAGFMRTRQEAEEADDALQNLISSLDNAAEAARRSREPVKDLREEYGRFAEAVREAAATRAQADLSIALKNLDAASEQARAGLTAFNESLFEYGRRVAEYDTIAETLGERTVSNASAFDEAQAAVDRARQASVDAAAALGLTVTEASALDRGLRALAEAEGMAGIAEAARDVLSQIQGMTGESENMSPAVAAIVVELERVLRAAAAGAVAMGDSADAADDTADAASRIGPALSSAVAQANAFANAMARARSESAGIGISTAGLIAQAEALESGKSEAVAAAEAAAVTRRQELIAAAGGSVGRGTSARIEQQVSEIYDLTLDAERAKERVRAAEESRRATSGTSGTSTGAGAATVSPAQQAQEYFETLSQEAALKRQLVGLNEDDAYALERSTEIKKRLEGIEEGLSSTYSERIEQLIKTELETRKLMEAEQQRQQLMDTVEGHIENAFMSFVDGSKSVEDAFRGMLRNIILAIYQQQVAQPAAEALGGLLEKGINALFKADGGAFNRGVQFFADGGVVNSPTMFGHSKGVGVMGEAGPEAIMPLKRGKDGKLGVVSEGGGSVTVENHFHIAANGDESVKRIVRGEIPRITEATKAAVADAKRRGGSYGRAFT